MSKSQITQKQIITQQVITAALHLLHNSYLHNTTLWPKKDFKVGYAIGKPDDDTIWVGVNAYGYEGSPVIGRLGFNKINNFNNIRGSKQQDAIKLVIDQAVYEGIYFEDELPTFQANQIWFKFTIL